MEFTETEDAFYEGGMFFKPGFGGNEWEALKQRLPIGSIITGKVIRQFPFGVFVDAGLGFVVLMHQGSFVRRTGSHDDYPPLHSELVGQLLGFSGREIIIGPMNSSGATNQ